MDDDDNVNGGGTMDNNGDSGTKDDGDNDGKGNGATDNNGDNVSGDDDDGNVQRVTTTTTMAMEDDNGDGVTDRQ